MWIIRIYNPYLLQILNNKYGLLGRPGEDRAPGGDRAGGERGNNPYNRYLFEKSRPKYGLYGFVCFLTYLNAAPICSRAWRAQCACPPTSEKTRAWNNGACTWCI